LKLRCE